LFDEQDNDEYLEEAKDLIIKADKASASYLQRRLRIGYARAARLLVLLEVQGIIGPADGSKPREVLVKNKEELEYTDSNKLEQMHEQLTAEESEYEEDDDEDEDENEE